MPSPRLALPAVLSTVAAAALVAGTASLALAAPPSHIGHPDSAGAHCKAARAEVQGAKKDLKQAHATGKPAKVEKAKDELKQQRKQASRWCSAAKSEAAATARAESELAGWAALSTDESVAALPADLQTALGTDATAAQGAITALETQIPGSSSPQLAHLVNQLRALDPTALTTALHNLGTALGNYSGDPTDLLSGVATALGAFDAAGHPTHLQALAGAVQDAADAIAAATVPAP